MKSPAFQFYPGDWLSSTDIQLMTPAEEGAYIRLLCHAWLQPDCGLPNTDEALAVLSRLGKSWPRSAARIRAKFEARDGKLFNPRMLAEKQKQEAFAISQSEAGRAGAQKRWGNNPNRVAIGSPQNGYRPATVSPMAENSSSVFSLQSSDISGVANGSGAGEPPPAAEDSERYAYIRNGLHDFFDGLRGFPDDDIVNRILQSARGRPKEAVGEVLRELHRRRKKPESWGFFPIVVERQLNGGAA